MLPLTRLGLCYAISGAVHSTTLPPPQAPWRVIPQPAVGASSRRGRVRRTGALARSLDEINVLHFHRVPLGALFKNDGVTLGSRYSIQFMAKIFQIFESPVIINCNIQHFD